MPQCSVYTLCSPIWPNWVKNIEADSEREISGEFRPAVSCAPPENMSRVRFKFDIA